MSVGNVKALPVGQFAATLGVEIAATRGEVAEDAERPKRLLEEADE